MRSVRPVGHQGILVECDDLADVLALSRALDGRRPSGVADVVPGARTVLVVLDDATAAGRTGDGGAGHSVRRELASALVSLGVDGAPEPVPLREVVVEVTYDGADLDEVAELTGIPREEVVRRHLAAEHVVAFTGFAPGFGYIAGGDPSLAVPRRTTPRTRVPAGSVALAGEFTGIYPREGPGGWQLVGRTDAVLWDLRRDPPALLAPGTRVRFTEVAP